MKQKRYIEKNIEFSEEFLSGNITGREFVQNFDKLFFIEKENPNNEFSTAFWEMLEAFMFDFEFFQEDKKIREEDKDVGLYGSKDLKTKVEKFLSKLKTFLMND